MALENKVAFTNRLYGNKEEFPARENCQECKHPMPQFAAYTGPICSWALGGCGFTPETTKYIYAKINAQEDEQLN